jgi:hypothetical protein
MKPGDTTKLIGIPANVRNDEELQTRARETDVRVAELRSALRLLQHLQHVYHI